MPLIPANTRMRRTMGRSMNMNEPSTLIESIVRSKARVGRLSIAIQMEAKKQKGVGSKRYDSLCAERKIHQDNLSAFIRGLE
jgi:hypothetical protein